MMSRAVPETFVLERISFHVIEFTDVMAMVNIKLPLRVPIHRGKRVVRLVDGIKIFTANKLAMSVG